MTVKLGKGLISEGLERFGWRGAADFYYSLQRGNTPYQIHSIENLVPLHVYENSSHIFIDADLPGFMADEIGVRATADRVTIDLHLPSGGIEASAGETADEGRKTPVFLSREYPLSSPVKVDSGCASFKKCTLKIQLPKVPFASAVVERRLPVHGED